MPDGVLRRHSDGKIGEWNDRQAHSESHGAGAIRCSLEARSGQVEVLDRSRSPGVAEQDRFDRARREVDVRGKLGVRLNGDGAHAEAELRDASADTALLAALR